MIKYLNKLCNDPPFDSLKWWEKIIAVLWGSLRLTLKWMQRDTVDGLLGCIEAVTIASLNFLHWLLAVLTLVFVAVPLGILMYPFAVLFVIYRLIARAYRRLKERWEAAGNLMGLLMPTDSKPISNSDGETTVKKLTQYLVTLKEILLSPKALQSDYCRYHARMIAEMASRGHITSLVAGEARNCWYCTKKGHSFLRRSKVDILG